jgi:hypothetical protein
LLQRLSIGLAGFQLAPQVAADGSLQIVPLPSQYVLTRNYAIPESRLGGVAAWQQQLHDAQLELMGSQLQVIGRVEDHRQIESWLQAPSARIRAATRLGAKRFTLTVKNQRIDAVLAAVARQANLQLVWPDESETLQQALVSLSVDNVSLGELLSHVLSDQGAKFRIQDGQLRIELPSEKPVRE